MSRALSVGILILAGLLVLPLAVGIAAREWWRVWRHGPAPSPFLPEHPDSFRAWQQTMERGRSAQAREEG